MLNDDIFDSSSGIPAAAPSTPATTQTHLWTADCSQHWNACRSLCDGLVSTVPFDCVHLFRPLGCSDKYHTNCIESNVGWFVRAFNDLYAQLTSFSGDARHILLITCTLRMFTAAFKGTTRRICEVAAPLRQLLCHLNPPGANGRLLVVFAVSRTPIGRADDAIKEKDLYMNWTGCWPGVGLRPFYRFVIPVDSAWRSSPHNSDYQHPVVLRFGTRATSVLALEVACVAAATWDRRPGLSSDALRDAIIKENSRDDQEKIVSITRTLAKQFIDRLPRPASRFDKESIRVSPCSGVLADFVKTFDDPHWYTPAKEGEPDLPLDLSKVDFVVSIPHDSPMWNQFSKEDFVSKTRGATRFQPIRIPQEWGEPGRPHGEFLVFSCRESFVLLYRFHAGVRAWRAHLLCVEPFALPRWRQTILDTDPKQRWSLRSTRDILSNQDWLKDTDRFQVVLCSLLEVFWQRFKHIPWQDKDSRLTRSELAAVLSVAYYDTSLVTGASAEPAGNGSAYQRVVQWLSAITNFKSVVKIDRNRDGGHFPVVTKGVLPRHLTGEATMSELWQMEEKREAVWCWWICAQSVRVPRAWRHYYKDESGDELVFEDSSQKSSDDDIFIRTPSTRPRQESKQQRSRRRAKKAEPTFTTSDDDDRPPTKRGRH